VQVFYYTLRCASSLPGFPDDEVTVKRRFSDFDQLHHMLRQHHQGYFVPPLPSKSFFESKVAHTDSFLRVRRVDLQVRRAGQRAGWQGRLARCWLQAAQRAPASSTRIAHHLHHPRTTPTHTPHQRTRPPTHAPTNAHAHPYAHTPTNARAHQRTRPPTCPPTRPPAHQRTRATPQAYIRAVASHPVLRTSEEVRLFLTLPGELSYQPQWVQLVEHRASMLDNIKGLIGGALGLLLVAMLGGAGDAGAGNADAAADCGGDAAVGGSAGPGQGRSAATPNRSPCRRLLRPCRPRLIQSPLPAPQATSTAAAPAAAPTARRPAAAPLPASCPA
jgi:hypothetical protein